MIRIVVATLIEDFRHRQGGAVNSFAQPPAAQVTPHGTAPVVGTQLYFAVVLGRTEKNVKKRPGATLGFTWPS